MSTYVFSAEHAMDRFLTKSEGQTVLLTNNNGEQALATGFFDNEADIVAYRDDYPDTVNVIMADSLSTGAVSDDFLLKLSYGSVAVEKESVLAKQSRELTEQVKARPLFTQVINDTLVLVH